MNASSAFILHRVSIISCLRALICVGMALIACASSNAQSLILQVDVSNPAAVTFTATTAPSSLNFDGTGVTSVQTGNPVNYVDGFSLIGFFRNNVSAGQWGGDGSGATVGSSTLAAGLTNTVYFDQTVTWKDTDPGNNVTDARDLNIWANNSTALQFDTLTRALTGVMTYNFTTGTVDHTGDLPTVGMSGNITIPYGNGTIGTWSVVSAIPEPSTYAALFGASALIGTIALRRRTQHLA